jgi:ankyrin repeat protein
MTGDAEILDLLLRNGADPRAKDKSGKTALSFAKESRREDKIQVLKRAALQAR